VLTLLRSQYPPARFLTRATGNGRGYHDALQRAGQRICYTEVSYVSASEKLSQALRESAPYFGCPDQAPRPAGAWLPPIPPLRLNATNFPVPAGCTGRPRLFAPTSTSSNNTRVKKRDRKRHRRDQADIVEERAVVTAVKKKKEYRTEKPKPKAMPVTVNHFVI
jgi:hypothetical protein